ncbi:hypothetical protein M427DRAFT_47675 [Gonapodya prolifera JEL478]|uniref:Phosphatidylinositol 4-kinase n=1 Tax=Gonapodya prolifera (strain JEL478) TaxID=1344416 RepID=A0A139A294_GONPJ|nr:hypothetical protein M427DRAFT_47675 [Gonapodya prolifera JEL478]|eukprot:KXS10897.1 hypothetical protein M427DRAFT_47675 [Gonapodya prolifera JEL478]
MLAAEDIAPLYTTWGENGHDDTTGVLLTADPLQEDQNLSPEAHSAHLEIPGSSTRFDHPPIVRAPPQRHSHIPSGNDLRAIDPSFSSAPSSTQAGPELLPRRSHVGARHRSRSEPFPGIGVMTAAGTDGTKIASNKVAELNAVDLERELRREARDSGFDGTPPLMPRSRSYQPAWTRDFRQNITRRFSQLQTYLNRQKSRRTPYSHLTTLEPPPATSQNPISPITSVSTAEFARTIQSSVRAISSGIQPELIVKGSSGSYFVKGESGATVGVYKPRDEEPYGAMNPKWTKWLHRNLLPCCFGRNCLIPNLGYVSEAAASFVDRKMGLNIVPRTEIVSLSSPAFHYSQFDRATHNSGTIPLPLKTGSFQLFVRGFKDSGTFFREGYERAAMEDPTASTTLGCRPPGSSASLASSWAATSRQTSRYSLASFEGAPIMEQGDAGGQSRIVSPHGEGGPSKSSGHPMGWSERTQREFQLQFERLVVLDYLIRNTDRGMDNWLVRYDPTDEDEEVQSRTSDATGENVLPPSEPVEEAPRADQETTVQMSATEQSSPSGSVLIKVEEPEARTPVEPTIRIAAIDNGLAFPHKHPDQWRSYPYGWAFLPIARVPFSQNTRELVLPLLTNEAWWSDLFEGLEQLFRVDPGFDEGMWRRQKAVMRGQGYNLVEILRRSEVASAPGNAEAGSPWALVRRPNVMVYEEHCYVWVPGDIPEGVVGFSAPPTPSHEAEGRMRRRIRTVRQRFEALTRQPCFTWC